MPLGETQIRKLSATQAANVLQDNPIPALCNSCGTPLSRDYWKCEKCNARFCDKCGRDFQDYLKNLLPYCPTCGIELLPESTPTVSPEGLPNKSLIIEKKSEDPPVRNVPFKTIDSRPMTNEINPQKRIPRQMEPTFEQPISNEQKILRYLQTANLRSGRIRKIKNKQALLKRISEIFKLDLNMVEKIWLGFERTHPGLIAQVTSKLQDEVLRRAHYEALHPKLEQPLDFAKLPFVSVTKNKELNLKEVKPADGTETEWKKGKMKPVEQKNYRSKFDES